MFKMTHNILRNLVVKKSTRRYPFEVRETFDKVRGELVNDIVRCIFCGSCEVKCPSQCIEVDRKAAVWNYDPFACVFCGVCVDICPAKSLFQKTQYLRSVGQTCLGQHAGRAQEKGERQGCGKGEGIAGGGAGSRVASARGSFRTGRGIGISDLFPDPTKLPRVRSRPRGNLFSKVSAIGSAYT